MKTLTLPPWNASAASLVKQFFATGAGELFLAHLVAERPSLLSGNPNPDAVALAACEVAGYEKAVNKILSLQEPPVEAPDEPEAYPPLDDDRKWADAEPPKK